MAASDTIDNGGDGEDNENEDGVTPGDIIFEDVAGCVAGGLVGGAIGGVATGGGGTVGGAAVGCVSVGAVGSVMESFRAFFGRD